MSRRAWYIGCSEEEVGEGAVLVGDPGRIERIAEHLSAPHFVEENRGLRTVTGERAGRRITATAFGMGAPIAAIVLHELFDLGVRAFLRIGTAMVDGAGGAWRSRPCRRRLSSRGDVVDLCAARLPGRCRFHAERLSAHAARANRSPVARRHLRNL